MYRPTHLITNAELAQAFNAYANLHNYRNAPRIAVGEVPALGHSSVEFIEKASGIQQRFVVDKVGVLDPTRMRPHWLHQANLGMNQIIVKQLVGQELRAGEYSDLAPVILGAYANTASAGSISAFHPHRANLAAGDLGVICSFGAGYSVGSVVVRRL